MESGYIKLLICIIFVTLSNSKSIIKTLPGFAADLPFTLETGYVGVGTNDEIQFFYYFVESQRDPTNDPLLIYLTGGPGTSGLFPFFYQVGPLTIGVDSYGWNNYSLELNPNTWTKTASVIFLDLPAGVGFSYATTLEGWGSNDTVLSLRTYEFLKKWFVEHPRFVNNPLYISGISYMGMLIPLITLEVYKGNERGTQQQMNIKGYLIVSPFTDRFLDINQRLEFAHRVTLISDDIYESTKVTCRGNYAYPDPSNVLCLDNLQRVDECTSDVNFANILGTVPDNTAEIKIILDGWANEKEVQKALHVREGTIDVWEKTNETIHYTFGKNDSIYYQYNIFSTIDYHKQLVMKNCQVLIMSGDHDMIIPHVSTAKWVKSLNVPIKSPWNPWLVDTQVAGYKMTYANAGYSLTYATVKGAGHSLQLNKPREASVLVEEWLASQTSISDS